MNVEIGAEAALFPEKVYSTYCRVSGIFVAVMWSAVVVRSLRFSLWYLYSSTYSVLWCINMMSLF